jgi:hypothetical protein
MPSTARKFVNNALSLAVFGLGLSTMALAAEVLSASPEPKAHFAPKPVWQQNGSASIRTYAGSTLRYQNENEPGAYHGLGLGVSYRLSEFLQLSLGASVESNPDANRQDDPDHAQESYDSSDLGLTISAPKIMELATTAAVISGSLSGYYPMSRASREHQLYTTGSSQLAIQQPLGMFAIGADSTYVKNFFRYTEQLTEIKRGDQVGNSHTSQIFSLRGTGSVNFSKEFSSSFSYGFTRIYPYTGEVVVINNSHFSLGYSFGKLRPYLSIRTAASQWNHQNEINYAVFEINRSKGELGATYAF